MRRQKDLTPASYAVHLQKPKGHRSGHTRLSCEPCRRSKVKCDQARPCRGCVKRGRDSECTYNSENANSPPRNRTGGRSPDEVAFNRNDAPQTVSALNERIKTLEASLGDLKEMVSRSGVGTPIEDGSIDEGDEVNHASHPPARKKETKVRAKRPLADARLDRGFVKKQGVTYFVGPTGWLVDMAQFDEMVAMFRWRRLFTPHWDVFRVLREHFQPQRRSYLTSPIPVLATVSPTSREDLIKLLPSREMCACLVSRFMDTFNMTHPVLNPVAFSAELADFWQAKTPLSTAWVVLLLAVISIGYRLPIHPASKDQDNTKIDADEEARKLLFVVSATFFSSPSMQRRPDLQSFQIMLLLILAQKLDLLEPDGVDSQNGLLGIASRMTTSMGLHRDPEMCFDMHDHEAEMRRRLWTTFVFLDLEHTIQSGMPFRMRKTDYDSAIPDNLDDADFVISPEMLATNEFRSLPDSEYTDATYIRQIYRSLPIWIDATHLCQSTREAIPRTETQSLEGRLLTLSASVHPCLKSDMAMMHQSIGENCECTASIQRAIIHCFNLRTRMLVYRSLFNNSLFPESYNVVLSCAQSILGYQRSLTHMAAQCATEEQSSANLLFLMSLLRCDFARSIIAIIRILSESTKSNVHFPPTLDTDRLLKIVHDALDIWLDSVHFSFTIAKEYMACSQALAAVEERLRLAREQNIKNIDISSVEAKPIIHAMLVSSMKSLAQCRQTLERKRSGTSKQNDPTQSQSAPSPTHNGKLTPTSLDAVIERPSSRIDQNLPVPQDPPWSIPGNSILTDGDMDMDMDMEIDMDTFFNFTKSWQSFCDSSVEF